MTFRPPLPLGVAGSIWLYRLLTRAYPREFCERFGSELIVVFRDLAREAWRDRGWRGLASLWGRTALDLALSAVPEQLSELQRRVRMSPKTSAFLALALILAASTGYLNTHTDELLVLIPWMIVVTIALGVAQPRRPWLWAILIGLSVPLSLVLFYSLGLRVPYPNQPSDILTSCIVILPAFVGAYVGAGIRRLAV